MRGIAAPQTAALEAQSEIRFWTGARVQTATAIGRDGASSGKPHPVAIIGA